MEKTLNQFERLKAFKDGLDALDDIMRFARQGNLDGATEDDFHRWKWWGLFHRKQTPGFFMLRLRIPNGKLRAHQIKAIGRIANEFGRGAADLTTRQNIQLRWIEIKDVPEIFERLRRVAIDHRQTGMDNFRNVTGCPVAGLDANEVIDASPFAKLMTDAIVGFKRYSNLPRKFNPSITGCRQDCANAQVNDLAFTPATKVVNGKRIVGFHVWIGGALGSKPPMLAQRLGIFVRPEEVGIITRLILDIYREHGNREHRHQARLKFLLMEWGLERFLSELERRFGAPLEPEGDDEVTCWGGDHLGVHRQKNGLYYVGCCVPTGRITGDQLIEFGRLAETYGNGELRLTIDQNIIIVNVPRDKLNALLDEPLLQTFSPFPSPLVRGLVTCTGIDYCHFSQIEVKARAIEFVQELEALLPADHPLKTGEGFVGRKLRIHWSGCPHSCGQHQIADIGFLGVKVRTHDGQIAEGTTVFVGGRLGDKPKIAQEVAEKVPCALLAPTVMQLLNRVCFNGNDNDDDSDGE
ncbi:Sulfite reductase [ferredoxin] [bacterium HR17]|uniref:Sulfite reductase [ferredoxin] n=1 Tax=Candidatus Fervidibacter japonicus TaxID=2035412 RepID=A0A2H5X9G7_9BACT|nr:Sulfite reductase [ferredoxin] [bacterium HR17]